MERVLTRLWIVGIALTIPTGTVWAQKPNDTSAGLRTLFQNNLNASDDVNHVGFILLDAVKSSQADDVCSSIGQSLLSMETLQYYTSDLALSLNYEEYTGRVAPGQYYLVKDGVIQLSNDTIVTGQYGSSSNIMLPAICSNNALASEPQNSTATTGNRIDIQGDSSIYQGYFNKKSFRFLGIREQCVQSDGGSEDCLFLNVQTPYLPRSGDTSHLRPVMFWIHGGGFTSGSGADPLSDGSNLASREDIVVVTINYRLSTLGFLAVPGSNITGNFGVGDQVTALDWTIQNIAYFGGDPSKITIIGESAGAGSVRTLLSSPRAIGKFSGAVAMSNLGGGQDLGLTSNYGTTYSLYYSIDQSFNVSGSKLVNATNRTAATVDQEIACLRSANATILNAYSSAPRYVVQDNIYVNMSELELGSPNNGTAEVPTIFGNVANDGASFSKLPVNVTSGNLTGALQVGLGISESAAQSIITSGLFPYANITGNWTLDAFNVTQRVATDNTFLCIDQATIYAGSVNQVFPSAYYYQFERAISGYNPNNLPGAPVTPGYPDGNPDEPYYKLHGVDMPWVFGNFYETLRDSNDLYSVQLVSGLFAAFVRTGNPNPDLDYLRIRGYDTTVEALQMAGTWDAVDAADDGGSTAVRHLDYPGYSGGFVDVEQRAWLGYPLDFYLDRQIS